MVDEPRIKKPKFRGGMGDMSGAPVAGDVSACLPEFAQAKGVAKIFGLKEGSLKNLAEAGKVYSAKLRPTGKAHGVRLYHLASVRLHVWREMKLQNPAMKLPADVEKILTES